MERENEHEIVPVLRPYSTTELAPFLGRSPRQARRELAKSRHLYGERVGQRWNPRQVKMIFDNFGITYIEYKSVA